METSKRRSRPLGRSVQKALTTSVAIAVIGAGSWGAVNTPVFHARHVRVSGMDRLSREAVLERAGIGATTNVLRLRPGQVEARLLTNPWIAEAVVERDLPDTVTIAIRERRTVATMRSGRGWALLAGDAVVVGLQRRRPDLPVVKAPPAVADERRLPRPGVVAVGARVAFARPLVAVLSAFPADVSVAEIHRPGEGGAELRLKAGTLVRYGEATGAARKRTALVALLRWARGQGRTIRTIDVRVPEAPSVTLVPA